MAESNPNASAKGGQQGAISDNEQAVAYYKPILLDVLTRIQTMLMKSSEDWQAMETLKEDVSKETLGVVLYHKLLELEKIMKEEESRYL